MIKKIITRFAPSPTGLLHVGNIRTALFNYLFSLKDAGEFILRIDDTDTERSKIEYADQILRDLDWLGIKLDKIYKQSERIEIYNKYFQELIDNNLIYKCFESPEELDTKRKRLVARRMPPIYDRSSLYLSESEIKKYLDEGRKPYWRFKLSGKRINFEDLIRGNVSVDTSAQSDPVIVREDGGFLYNLPSVIDDIEMGITNIIRGEDHVTNSAIQVEMFRSLGKEAPVFGHHPLLVDENGDPFSKRNSAVSIKGLMEDNYEPMAINSLNASIGTSIEINTFKSLNDIADRINLNQVARAPARFSINQLSKLNSDILSQLDNKIISKRLSIKNINFDEKIWNVIKSNIDNLSEYEKWDKIIKGSIKTDNLDSDYMKLAESLLPPEPWDEDTWGKWISRIKEISDKKGKDLFLPLRMAITGQSYGPELKNIILLMGYDKIKYRLSGN
ncbi:glutamate--tRNA ligase [Rhodobiaceae bacterium]|nr:glutamate--tRNA ligase [Rhodobiaceae bacterium]